VAPGQFVTQGEAIGEVGGDPGDRGRGLSTGAHLHFWITKGTRRLHPDEDIEWTDGGNSVDIARMTEAAQLAWDVKERLESSKPLLRKDKAALAAMLLKAVIVVKEEAGIQ